jgi:hypothetical protein
VEVRPPSQSDSRVATRGHFTVSVPSLPRGDSFEGRMQDGTITTESSHGRMGSVGRTPAGCHSGMGTGVHTLQSCSIYSYSRVLGQGRAQWFVGSHVLGFLPSPYRWVCGECVVSRGCSRLEERGSIYLVDSVAIIEVRGEEVLASTLDGSRVWRRGPGWPDDSELCWELWGWESDGDFLFTLCCCCIGNQRHFLDSFPPFRC